MPTISVSLPSDGTAASVSQYNTPITTIVNAINGNLDSSNISTLSGTKITAATLPGTAFDSTTAGGWITGLGAPNTITYNGNRSYSVVYSGVDKTGIISNGMRLQLTRTVAAPTQCTNLNGSTQYYSKSSPAGMTFTNNFVVSVWVKANSYTLSTIESRYNGTSGWELEMNAAGQILLIGYNAGSANYSLVQSLQSIPLARWVHITAQLDMASFTATTSTSYVMLDGTDVPAMVTRNGTNPTALIQAGNLEIGSRNGGTLPFPGEIAQAAVFSAKVTEATMQSYISQSFLGTETNLISAYSFNNSINDLNTSNANNLTANGSAVATSLDSPFTQDDTTTPTGTKDVGIIMGKTFSTNTTLTVQVPEGCMIPTSGGVSAVSYSPHKVPYGFLAGKNKWSIRALIGTQIAQTAVIGTWYNVGSHQLNVPIGSWDLSYSNSPIMSATAGLMNLQANLSITNNGITTYDTEYLSQTAGASPTILQQEFYKSRSRSFTTAIIYYLNLRAGAGSGTVNIYTSDSNLTAPYIPAYIEAQCTYV